MPMSTRLTALSCCLAFRLLLANLSQTIQTLELLLLFCKLTELSGKLLEEFHA